MSEHTLRLIGGDDDEEATVVAEPRQGRGRLCRIAFTYRGRVIEETASDYFEAFCRVRLRLEGEKLIPFCYGASLNVHPSGMSRDMSGGMVAYRLKVGRKPDRSDLVNIFDEGRDVIPASVANQKAFYDEWIAWVSSQPA